MLLFLLAQSLFYGDGTPPPPRPQGIFSYQDYPVEALRNHWEGSVVAELTVNERGAVTVCKIVKSSGHEVLDATTCNLLIQRAKFKPAMDDAGRPRNDLVQTPPINWKIH